MWGYKTSESSRLWLSHKVRWVVGAGACRHLTARSQLCFIINVRPLQEDSGVRRDFSAEAYKVSVMVCLCLYLGENVCGGICLIKVQFYVRQEKKQKMLLQPSNSILPNFEDICCWGTFDYGPSLLKQPTSIHLACT